MSHLAHRYFFSNKRPFGSFGGLCFFGGRDLLPLALQDHYRTSSGKKAVGKKQNGGMKNGGKVKATVTNLLQDDKPDIMRQNGPM